MWKEAFVAKIFFSGELEYKSFIFVFRCARYWATSNKFTSRCCTHRSYKWRLVCKFVLSEQRIGTSHILYNYPRTWSKIFVENNLNNFNVYLIQNSLKGTLSRDFDFRFSSIVFPRPLSIILVLFLFFSQILEGTRYTMHHECQWHW